MPFGFNNVPPTYQRVMSMTFKDYLGVLMKLFRDDFNVFNNLDTYLIKLQLCFDKCREFSINLNLEKNMFLMHIGVILRYVVFKEGKLSDPKANSAIVHMPTPKIVKDIQVFNGMA
jgi:hypothetical protein